MFDIAKHQREFSDQYLTVLEGVLPRASVEGVYASFLGDALFQTVDVDAPADPETLTYGGVTRYDFWDYAETLRVAPVVRGWYEALLPLVQAVTGMEAIHSPYESSAVITLLYRDNGGQQEYHLDTQPITVLLYLNDNPTSGATSAYRHGDNKLVEIHPQCGNILLMRGRDVKHAGLPVTEGNKLVMPMNFYVEGDVWRPEALNDSAYWDKRQARGLEA